MPFYYEGFMAVATNVDIVNLALDRLGVEPIVTLADANSRAELMNRLYSPQLDSLLVETPWNFAMKRVQLTDTGSTPAFEYSNEFQLPADFLKVHRIYDYNPVSGTGTKHPYDHADGGIYYEIEDDKLLGNFDECYIVYIAAVTDVTKFSPDFVEAFWLRLAAAASYKITQDKTLKNELVSEADYYVRRSAALSAQQDYAADDTVFFGSFIYPRST